ncbi:MAG: inositol monophosphatase family protein [Bdellovibrionota bacterium]
MEREIVEGAFRNIPTEQILSIATTLRDRANGRPLPAMAKGNGQFVTQADIGIQREVLRYFAGTELAGTYVVKAEEQLDSDCVPPKSSDARYQLLVDPLDGTDSYCRGESSWGTMIGLADSDGRLVYSWNMISEGEVYSSANARPTFLPSFARRLESADSLRVDVYDYGAGSVSQFARRLAALSGGTIDESKVRVSSAPAAVTAGWQLATRELDGLLWLPSEKGKCSYPDYDLVFLGALVERGWHVTLGKNSGCVLMVIVAPTAEDLELLKATGLAMIAEEQRSCLQFDSGLQITQPNQRA